MCTLASKSASKAAIKADKIIRETSEETRNCLYLLLLLDALLTALLTFALDKIIRETSEETRDYARTVLTLAMTSNHLLAGEEQLALHWGECALGVPWESPVVNKRSGVNKACTMLGRPVLAGEE